MCHDSMEGCSSGLAFRNLLRAPGPGGDGTPIKDGQVTKLFVGPTQHFIDENNLTVYNVALEGHLLSGTVTRRVVSENGWVYLETSKTGEFTVLNFLSTLPARSLWRDVDLRIQRLMHLEVFGE